MDTPDNNQVDLWNTADGDSIRSFIGHTSDISAVAFSPDGRNIITASSDSTIRVWDVSTGDQVKSFAIKTKVNVMALSRDGSRIAAGLGTGGILLLNAETGEPIRTFLGYQAATGVAFSPDGSRIVSCAYNGTAVLWDCSGNAEAAPARLVRMPTNIRCLSAQRRSLTFAIPGAAAGSVVELVVFRPDGRMAAKLPMQRPVHSWSRASFALPHALSPGMYVYRFTGVNHETGGWCGALCVPGD
jgi:WD40 repeat protein